MFCYKTCGLAFVFLFGMIYLTFSVDKTNLKDSLMNTLDKQNQKKYENIVKERRDLYLTGYLLGFAIALIALLVIPKSFGRYSQVCFVIAVSYIIMYFFYTLSPKSDYMILHLNDLNQRQKWLNIYKTMQYNYHLGLLLGIVFIGLFMLSFS